MPRPRPAAKFGGETRVVHHARLHAVCFSLSRRRGRGCFPLAGSSARKREERECRSFQRRACDVRAEAFKFISTSFLAGGRREMLATMSSREAKRRRRRTDDDDGGCCSKFIIRGFSRTDKQPANISRRSPGAKHRQYLGMIRVLREPYSRTSLLAIRGCARARRVN